MLRVSKGIARKAGMPPGSLVHVGDMRMDKTRISLISYDAEQLVEEQGFDIEKILRKAGSNQSKSVVWINIDGLNNVKVIEKVGNIYGIHPLTMEDILNTSQRPKFEAFKDYIYVAVKILTYNSERQRIIPEQVSIVIGKGFVLTFQERIGDIFDPLRERIRNHKGLIRQAGADYLAYSLIDAVVDNCFVILEDIEEHIEFIEQQLLTDPDADIIRTINSQKRQIVYMRRILWPLREVANALTHEDSGIFTKESHMYMKDVHDHSIQVIETLETFRDVISGLQDIYLSSLSNKMNEVMKTLTIIATIFIPLTFIAGLYGMNFVYMPELKWRYGYPSSLIVMAGIAVLMVVYFRKKKWF